MSNVKFEHLFEPLQVGPMKVPNRIVETTNTINSSQIPGEIDDHFRAHHGAKAKDHSTKVVAQRIAGHIRNAPKGKPHGGPPARPGRAAAAARLPR